MTHIPFQAIAVDMDGTFLTDKKDYDHALFTAVLNAAHKNNIRFITASGNQFYKLQKDFGAHATAIDYVAENGAYLLQGGKTLDYTAIDNSLIPLVLEYLQPQTNVHVIISGLKQAYCLTTTPQTFRDAVHFYYPKTTEVSSYADVPVGQEPILKLSLDVPWEQTDRIADGIRTYFGNQFHITSSGNGSIDILAPDVNKANGLKQLLTTHGIKLDQLIAFGDNGNDAEMLKAAGLSYAMANGIDAVKNIADHEAPSNNENGVLKVLADYLL